MENPFEIIIDKLNRIESLLLLKGKAENSATESFQETNEILNTNEAAVFLSVAKSTLYGMTSQREIPHFKRGKKLYVKRSELEEWLTQHRVKTNGEIDRLATEYVSRNHWKGRR
jgi:excisionase family DNA binding protein